MIMITTLIINFHTLQSHYMHVVTIPCTTSTLRYQRPSPREPICTLFPNIVRLTLLYFDFSLNPYPLIFLRHFYFLLMTSFSVTLFFVFIISESLVHEGSRRDYSCLYLYQRTHADLPYPLPVSNVSYCISSDSSYPHRHLIKIVFAFFVIMRVTLIISDCGKCVRAYQFRVFILLCIEIYET
jgi:hypothetical protein